MTGTVLSPDQPCPTCRLPGPAGARFCPGCGEPLVADRAAEQERRLVSVLFCDLVDSTGLSGQLDPEALRSVVLQYFELMRRIVTAHEGTVEKFIGDAVMATFGLPRAREDDARRALASALGMLSAIPRINRRLQVSHGVTLAVRVGVHTGDVVAAPTTTSGHGQLSGETANVAARLCAQAAPGQALASRTTVQAAGAGVTGLDVGPLALRGKQLPVPALAVTGLGAADPRSSRRFDVRFVGRGPERAQLDWALAQVRRHRTVRQVTVFGPPGAGRTRLLTHWSGTLDPTTAAVGYGRCDRDDPRGPYAALLDAVAQVVVPPSAAAAPEAAAGRPAVRAHRTVPADLGGRPGPGDLLQHRLLGPGRPCRQLARDVVAFLEPAARERCAVLVVDDCHLARPELLDLLEHLVPAAAHLPVLLVHSARPELTDRRPSWQGDRLEKTSFMLPGLSRGQARRLARDLTAADGAGAATTSARIARAVESAGGNPYAVELLLQHRSERPGRAVTDLPPALRLLLAAWADQLDGEQRTVVECAAVLGLQFSATALTRLLEAVGPPVRTVPEVVATLLERQVFLPVAGRAGRLRFTGPIWRDTLYEATSKRTRLSLHLAQADLVEAGGDLPAAQLHRDRARVYSTQIGQWTARAAPAASGPAGPATDRQDRPDGGRAGAAGQEWPDVLAAAFAVEDDVTDRDRS